MKADDVLKQLIGKEKVVPKVVTAREFLKTAKVGDVVRFKDGAKGIVIWSDFVGSECWVDGKAILYTHQPNKEFSGVIAGINGLDEEVLL